MAGDIGLATINVRRIGVSAIVRSTAKEAACDILSTPGADSTSSAATSH